MAAVFVWGLAVGAIPHVRLSALTVALELNHLSSHHDPADLAVPFSPRARTLMVALDEAVAPAIKRLDTWWVREVCDAEQAEAAGEWKRG